VANPVGATYSEYLRCGSKAYAYLEKHRKKYPQFDFRAPTGEWVYGDSKVVLEECFDPWTILVTDYLGRDYILPDIREHIL
jgi:hypothetical protein